MKLATGATTTTPISETKPSDSGGNSASCGSPASIKPIAPAMQIGTATPDEVATALWIGLP